MTLISKTTWCRNSDCNGKVERSEQVIRTAGGWPKLFFIIYKCEKCGLESIINIKVNNKIKKRILEKGASFNR